MDNQDRAGAGPRTDLELATQQMGKHRLFPVHFTLLCGDVRKGEAALVEPAMELRTRCPPAVGEAHRLAVAHGEVESRLAQNRQFLLMTLTSRDSNGPNSKAPFHITQ